MVPHEEGGGLGCKIIFFNDLGCAVMCDQKVVDNWAYYVVNWMVSVSVVRALERDLL